MDERPDSPMSDLHDRVRPLEADLARQETALRRLERRVATLERRIQRLNTTRN